MVEFFASHKQGVLIAMADFSILFCNSCNSSPSCNLLAIWSAPVKVGASALTLAVKQAFFYGPRPDRPPTC